MKTKTTNSRRLIALPTYNEQQNISAVLTTLRATLVETKYAVDVVVFDDHSNDDTARVVEETGLAHMETCEERGGYWVNVTRAIRYAHRHGYDQLVLMDADGQHDPYNIITIFSALDKGHNLVIASRFGPGSDYRMGFSKRIGRALYRGILRMLVDYQCLDPTSGNVGFDAQALALLAEAPPNLLMDTALPTWALEVGLSVREVAGRFYMSDRSTLYKSLWAGFRTFCRTVGATVSARRYADACRRMISWTCPLCRTIAAPTIGCFRDGYTYFRCPACDFLSVSPFQSAVLNPADLYGSEYYEGDGNSTYYRYGDCEGIYRRQARRYIDVLRRWVPDGSSVRELGSGYGFFLQEAACRYQAHGVEISEAAVRCARQQGLTVYQPEELPQEAGQQCDALVLIDTAEHFRNIGAELTPWLEQVRSGGLVLIEVPDAGSAAARLSGRRWRLLIPPYHLGIPNARNLERFLQSAGFEICWKERPCKWQPLSMILSLVLRPAWLRSLDRRFGLSRRAFLIRMPDTLLVAARRLSPESVSTSSTPVESTASGLQVAAQDTR